jgi:hypothetical protein
MSTEITQPKNTVESGITQVSNPLTFVFNIKSEADALKVQQLLADPENKAIIQNAMRTIGTVHFARFVFLSPLQLAVITTYDGDFDKYIQAFTDKLGGIFNALLNFMHHPEGLIPVENNLALFQQFIRDNDRSRVNGVLQPEFSAYPTLTVYDILMCQSEQNDN